MNVDWIGKWATNILKYWCDLAIATEWMKIQLLIKFIKSKCWQEQDD